MRAWRLDGVGGEFALRQVPDPVAAPGAVTIRVEASAMLSYLGAFVAGELTTYHPPHGVFTPGTTLSGLCWIADQAFSASSPASACSPSRSCG